MWVKFDTDMTALNATLAGLPERLRPDAISGFGMGVSFTRVNHSEDFLRIGDSVSLATRRGCNDFLAGLAMGLSIRSTADRIYVDESLNRASSPDTARAAVRLREIGLNALQTLQDSQVEELHGNWRKAIASMPVTVSPDHPCQVPL
jgi:hypothetical protein